MAKSKAKGFKPKRSLTFRGWLKTCRDRDDPVGDLARDAFRDPNWKGRTVESLRSRIEAKGADDLVIEALKLAEAQYFEEEKAH